MLSGRRTPASTKLCQKLTQFGPNSAKHGPMRFNFGQHLSNLCRIWANRASFGPDRVKRWRHMLVESGVRRRGITAKMPPRAFCDECFQVLSQRPVRRGQVGEYFSSILLRRSPRGAVAFLNIFHRGVGGSPGDTRLAADEPSHVLTAEPTAAMSGAEPADDDVVVCCAVRTGVTRAKKGPLKD